MGYDKEPCRCEDFKKELEKAIQEELCAVSLYAEIADEAPCDELRELILSIVGDEYGHARVLTALLSSCPPCASCPQECGCATGCFTDDVETAISSELEAIRRYAELAMCAPDPKVRGLLTSILGDEYAHVRIWNAMLLADNVCGCGPCPCKP